MKDNNQSTNDQRANELRALRDLAMTATLFLIVVAAIVLLSMALEQNTKDSEARCKSLGGIAGQSKCYKDGREI